MLRIWLNTERSEKTPHVVLSNDFLKLLVLLSASSNTFKNYVFQPDLQQNCLTCLTSASNSPNRCMSRCSRRCDACESMRPKKSMDPLEVHRTKSPVRYKRGAAPWKGPTRQQPVEALKKHVESDYVRLVCSTN